MRGVTNPRVLGDIMTLSVYIICVSVQTSLRPHACVSVHTSLRPHSCVSVHTSLCLMYMCVSTHIIVPHSCVCQYTLHCTPCICVSVNPPLYLMHMCISTHSPPYRAPPHTSSETPGHTAVCAALHSRLPHPAPPCLSRLPYRGAGPGAGVTSCGRGGRGGGR